MGQALGNNVYLSNTSIHFGEVQLEQTTNRLLNIVNDSDQPTTFQFFTDKTNVFAFNKTEGTIKANSQVRIIIEFFPQKTVSYYERVFCVVRNHVCLYVDLIGTCFDVLEKPMPLMQRHIDIFRHKVIMGVHNKIRKEKEVDMDDSNYDGGDVRSHNFSSMDLEINQEIPIDNPTQVVLHKEMFLNITDEKQEIKFSSDFYDFNFTHVGRISEQRSLSVKNKFSFPIDINWALLNVFNRVTEKWVKNPFKVRPETQRVEANSSFEFTAEFCPFEPDQYFF